VVHAQFKRARLGWLLVLMLTAGCTAMSTTDKGVPQTHLLLTKSFSETLATNASAQEILRIPEGNTDLLIAINYAADADMVLATTFARVENATVELLHKQTGPLADSGNGTNYSVRVVLPVPAEDSGRNLVLRLKNHAPETHAFTMSVWIFAKS
jgi:hypothetical protein